MGWTPAWQTTDSTRPDNLWVVTIFPSQEHREPPPSRRLRDDLEPHEVAGTRVLLTDHLGPAAAGVRSPVILLPRWVLELDASLRELVLAHEQEHVDAHDPLLLLLGLGVLVLVPWHLPLWWSWRRLQLAIEVDCDARVLGRRSDVRRYGELLLLISQRVIRARWASRPVVTMAAPLQPRRSHLAERIQTMTQPRLARSDVKVALLAGGVLAVSALACVLPRPQATTQATSPVASSATASNATAPSVVDSSALPPLTPRPATGERALVHLTSAGLVGVETDGDSLRGTILIFSPGAARVGIGDATPTPLTDTLRLHRFPAMTLDVTDSDVHVLLLGRGRLAAAAAITGGPSTGVSASGKHLVFLQGGRGVGVP